VIAFSGRHIAQNQYRNAYQELPHEPLYQSVTKWQGRVDFVEQIPHVLRQAFREATTGTPRPVHIDMAGYTGDATTADEGMFDVIVDEAHTRFPAFRPGPDPEAVQKAAAAIKAASRPVIVAEHTAEICGARDALARLAEKIQAPVVATLDAKAIIVEDHPLFRGTLGTYGRSCANHVVAEADLVIYAGGNTSDQSTANWKIPKEGTKIIHMDLDPVELGRNYTGVIGIQADVRLALEAVAAAVQPVKREAWLAQSQEHVDAWRKETEPARASEKVPMWPQRVCKEVTECLPQDAILIADTGYAALWTGTLVYLNHPTQNYYRAAGSLGWSFPAALGAKCGAPNRPVIAFTGDGGFYYHLPELETARRRGIKTVTVVNNNRCLAQGVRNLTAAYGSHDKTNMGECYEYRNTDFAKVAQAFDCFGVTVEKPQDFRKAFDAAMASELPAVIDVKTEPGLQAPLVWAPA
jgi:acetolactate synthase-1/2/3 large subunit